MLTEFGCCTYRDAPDFGATGRAVLDRTVSPPRLTRQLVRDETVRATEIRDLREIYRQEPVHAAFVFTWANYTYPFDTDPQRNLDTAGYGIVAVQPDGTWHPKAAFGMLASSANGCDAGSATGEDAGRCH